MRIEGVARGFQHPALTPGLGPLGRQRIQAVIVGCGVGAGAMDFYLLP